MCVCPQGGEGVCLSACWDAIPPRWRPPWMENPPGWRPPRDGEPPWMENPPDGEPPLDGEPPQMENPPGMENSPWDGEPHPPWMESSPPGWRTPPDGEPPRDGEPPPDGEPPRMENPPPGSRLQHTVYERPVCILLECILVFISAACTICREQVMISRYKIGKIRHNFLGIRDKNLCKFCSMSVSKVCILFTESVLSFYFQTDVE